MKRRYRYFGTHILPNFQTDPQPHYLSTSQVTLGHHPSSSAHNNGKPIMISKRRNKALSKLCVDSIPNQDVGETARAVG